MAPDPLSQELERLQDWIEQARLTTFECECQRHERLLVLQEALWRRRHSLNLLPAAILGSVLERHGLPLFPATDEPA